jgi:chromosome segregation ATPase
MPTNPINDVQLELLRSIKDKTDKTDDTLSQIAGSIQTLAVTLAKLEESHASMQRQQSAQKEVDEYQNHRIEGIQSDLHKIEKDIIPLKSTAVVHEKKLDRLETEMKKLSEGQVLDNHNWSGLKVITQRIIIPLLLSAITALGGYVYYLSTKG